MRTVDDFARIRQAHRDGLSSRQIAKQLGVGRDTVRKALQHAEPPPYTLAQPRPTPVFGPFREFVDEILAEDENAPRKQRHTASPNLPAPGRREGLHRQVRPDPPLPSATTTRPPRNVHPAGASAGRRVPRPTSDTSTSTFPMAVARFRS